MQGLKGDIGYPGIGLPGWTGQKVILEIILKMIKIYVIYF